MVSPVAPVGDGFSRRAVFRARFLNAIEYARDVSGGARETRIVSFALKIIDSYQHHVRIVWLDGDEALGIIQGAGVVLKLLAGFNERAIDGGFARRVGILQKILLKISDQSYAIASGRANRLFERKFRATLAF